MPERFSYTNALREVHPVEKMFFSFSCMTISLICSSIAVYLIVLIIMAAVLVFLAKIPLLSFFKMISGAVMFVALGSVVIAYGDLHGAILVFFRAFAAISCFYFLILTTPVADILAVLRRCRIPAVVCEVMGLTYRFIFLFMDISHKTRTAQLSRLGYDGLINSYRSMGILVASLFQRMFRQADILNTALQSRGFTGELRVMQRAFKISPVNIATISVINLILIFVGLG